MKKFISILLIVLLCLCLSGCDENCFPTAAYGKLIDTINNADTALAESNIEDVAGFRTIMHNLAYTIDKDRRYDIYLLYEDLENGSIYNMPLSGMVRRMNSNEYRKELEANLVISFLNVLQSDQSTVSDHGNIHAVILRWQSPDFFGRISSYVVCDFDGDGTWDYGAKDDDETLTMSFASYSSKEACPKRKINQYEDAYLICNRDIIGLKDLSRKETMKHFEQLL